MCQSNSPLPTLDDHCCPKILPVVTVVPVLLILAMSGSTDPPAGTFGRTIVLPVDASTIEIAPPEVLMLVIRLSGGANTFSALLTIMCPFRPAPRSVEGVDFSITEVGDIDWTLGMSESTAPSPGTFYSIQYYAHPVYVVRSMPYNFRDITIKTKVKSKKHQELPTKVLCWLEFLGSNDD